MRHQLTMLLGADIGGTKTLLALARARDDGGFEIDFEQSYASAQYETFDALLARFLAQARDAGLGGSVDAASIGVAGPVRHGRAKVTYLPWQLDAAALGRQVGGAPVQLVNDFAAAAAGVIDASGLPLECLQFAEADAAAPRVVLGAGTGLGVAALTRLGERWKIVSGEGGHVGFAPADAQQARLRDWLARRDPRVTAERVLCGAGLADIYRFLCEEGAVPAESDPLATPDAAAAISAAGQSAPASTCARALDLFCSVYGAFAGDLALLFDARGGVFLAGGIAAKIIGPLRAGAFSRAFNDKGLHSRLSCTYPVHVVMEPRLGLLGTLQLAARRGFAET